MTFGNIEIVIALGLQTIAIGAFLGAANGSLKRVIRDVERMDIKLLEMIILPSVLKELERRLDKLEATK